MPLTKVIALPIMYYSLKLKLDYKEENKDGDLYQSESNRKNRNQ